MNPWPFLFVAMCAVTLLPWALITVGDHAKRRSIAWLADNIEAHWDREAEAANRAAETFTDADWAALEDELRGNA